MTYTALDKIVENRKMPLLFIGSGLSKRYLYNYPNWDELLLLSYQKIGADPFQYQKYKESFIRQGLSPFDVNVKMASVIEDLFNAAFFDRKIKLDRVKNPSWVKRNISPYKMFLSRYFKNLPVYRSAKTDLEISKLKQLKNKIQGKSLLK